VVLSTPKIPYKETVLAVGDGHYKHKKQSGGRGQYVKYTCGSVRRSRMIPNGCECHRWRCDSAQFPAGDEKGIVETFKKGAVAGFPVVNVQVTVYDGSYHDVDSSEIAFKIAGARAFHDGMSKAQGGLA